MLHRLILKVTKFQLLLPKRLSTVVKNILGGPPMPNRVNTGGTRKNFDRNASVTFLGLKFDKLLFWGLFKMRVIFEGLKK